jgi:toxin ParE1/3/4
LNYEVRLGEQAYDDLAGIWNWVASEADVDTADAYSARIRGLFTKLVDFPRRGTPRDDLRPGVRSLIFERTIVIFYGIEGRTVTILRVVHGARDQAALFEP